MSLAAHHTLDAELRNDEWTGGLAAHLSARQTLEALMRGKVAYSLASSPHSLFLSRCIVSGGSDSDDRAHLLIPPPFSLFYDRQIFALI